MAAKQGNAVLLTGGMGYIGSHTAVEFLNAGKEIVILDDLFQQPRGGFRPYRTYHRKKAEILSGGRGRLCCGGARIS